MEPALSLEITSATHQTPVSDKAYGLREAYAHCMKLARAHYENFPVASLLIPKRLRKHIAAIYAFARTADDFADEPQFSGQRMERLYEWKERLNAAVRGQAEHPIFLAIADTLNNFAIPNCLLHDLLTAFKMDVVTNRYATFDGLLGYCRYSANPVGRLVLFLMGYPAPKLLEYSDAICTALQLTNFWQDVFIDLGKDRIYIPREDMTRFRYSEAQLKEKIINTQFRRLLHFEVQRTQQLFWQGAPLLKVLPGRLGMEIKMTWLGGMNILKKIIKVNADVLNHRPQLRKTDFLIMLGKTLLQKGVASHA